MIIASKFLDGAVKPWEWEEAPEEWLNWTLATRVAFARAQEIVNRQTKPKKKHG